MIYTPRFRPFLSLAPVRTLTPLMFVISYDEGVSSTELMEVALVEASLEKPDSFTSPSLDRYLLSNKEYRSVRHSSYRLYEWRCSSHRTLLPAFCQTIVERWASCFVLRIYDLNRIRKQLQHIGCHREEPVPDSRLSYLQRYCIGCHRRKLFQSANRIALVAIYVKKSKVSAYRCSSKILHNHFNFSLLACNNAFWCLDAYCCEVTFEMIEKLEDFDDVQNVYTKMKPAE